MAVDASDLGLADWILSFSAGASPTQVAELIRACLVETGAEEAPEAS